MWKAKKYRWEIAFHLPSKGVDVTSMLAQILLLEVSGWKAICEWTLIWKRTEGPERLDSH